MASSDALLLVILRRKPLSDSRSDDLISETRPRQPIKVHRFVILLLIALYVTLIVIHNGSASKNGASDKTTTVSRAHLTGVSEKRNVRKTKPFMWNNTMLSWQRTAFHFQPEKNWMNGIKKIKKKEDYLFYQLYIIDLNISDIFLYILYSNISKVFSLFVSKQNQRMFTFLFIFLKIRVLDYVYYNDIA